MGVLVRQRVLIVEFEMKIEAIAGAGTLYIKMQE